MKSLLTSQRWWLYGTAILLLATEVISPASCEEAKTAVDATKTTTGSHSRPIDERPLVGVYYYPWYVKPGDPASQWNIVFRQRLKPVQTPRAGLYSSDDPAVIKDHIAQSKQAGVGFWAVSWWGPNSQTDRVFRDAILTHPDAKELKFAVLYEATDRFGSFDKPNYDNWLADLEYMQQHYFNHPQYLRVNGRPAVFVYLTRVYFRNRGEDALSAMRRRFKDVYLIGDDVFGRNYKAEWAHPFDAVTIYDVYGQSAGAHGTTRKAVEALAANYSTARREANSVGVAFIPTVAPGYNDTAVREGHPGAARSFSDVQGSREGDFFRAQLREAALPNLDERCGRMMMVTSFNEWYEDSQIEATSGTAAATTEDASKSGTEYTAGARYEDYGTKYLDILREMTVGGTAEAGRTGAP
jgi:hypothetical protein